MTLDIPGAVLRTLCLEPLGLGVMEAATALGVSRKTLSGMLDGRTGISPEMALRPSLPLGTYAESRLPQQAQYHLGRAGHRGAQGQETPRRLTSRLPLSFPSS